MPRFGPEPQKFFASVYDGDAPWDIGEPQPALMQLFTEFPLIEPVLDVGCGSGDLSVWIAQQGIKVVGVDFVPAAIDLAKKRAAALTPALAANLEFRIADALHPASLGQFGSIVDSGFYHLFETEQCERFAQELVEAVRPGGRYYLLAFAIEFPVPDVPRAVTEAEIRKHFIETGNWTGLVLRPAEFVSRVGNVAAICACLERT